MRKDSRDSKLDKKERVLSKIEEGLESKQKELNSDMMDLEDFKRETFKTVDATLAENLEATKTL